MDKFIRIVPCLIYPSGFKIRSIADAAEFCKSIFPVGARDIPDVDDPTHYFSLIKEKSGRVLLGDAHFGPAPLLAEVPCCDDKDIYRRIYAIRKSINAKFFTED